MGTPSLLPDDATIQQVAQVWGVSQKVNQLTPAARRLTKGQMVALLGASSERAAVSAIAVGWRTPAPASVEKHAQAMGLRLTVADIQSLQTVFNTRAIPASERTEIRGRVAGGPAGARAEELPNINLYCCCCPCCCATAVLDPVQLAVA
jgi:hypothetical protein